MMAKALYTIKIEFLDAGNENLIWLTGCELQAIQCFNRFVVSVYVQAWFTCSTTVDASINDLKLIERLKHYDDEGVRNV